MIPQSGCVRSVHGNMGMGVCIGVPMALEGIQGIMAEVLMSNHTRGIAQG